MNPEQIREWSVLIQNIGVPIMILIFLAICLWKLIPVVISYINSIIEDKKNLAEDRKRRADESGEFRELIRNTNSVITNNTAALTLAETNQQLMVTVLGKHMDESRDAHYRLEGGLATIDSKLDHILTDVKIIKETH